MRTVTVQQRRAALVRRHRLAGDAADVEDAVRAVVALHATDPASVYLSVLARCTSATLADVAHDLYERRVLMRWLAMRRTLFVVARDDVPVLNEAVGVDLAATLRRLLVNRLISHGTEPPITGDVGRWLTRVGDATVEALRRRSSATGTQLSADVPRLRTSLVPGAPSHSPQNVTTSLLTVLGAEGRIVRGAANGPWTTRQHRWEPIERWWPDGVPAVDGGVPAAQRELARRWLARFGPATVEDLQWWTGWTKTTTRTVLGDVDPEEIDLHGLPGIALRGQIMPSTPTRTADSDAGVATLLPSLDPTPMGWKNRDWFFDLDPGPLYDRAGNIGPTVWWNGAVIGSWAVTASGGIRTHLVADRGADAADAVQRAAAALESRLGGAVVTPAVRTPLEHALATGARL